MMKQTLITSGIKVLLSHSAGQHIASLVEQPVLSVLTNVGFCVMNTVILCSMSRRLEKLPHVANWAGGDG